MGRILTLLSVKEVMRLIVAPLLGRMVSPADSALVVIPVLRTLVKRRQLMRSHVLGHLAPPSQSPS